MARSSFSGMNQSARPATSTTWEFAPGPALFRHWIEHLRDLTGSVYGRRMYAVMRYWDEDRPEWSAEQRGGSRRHGGANREVGRVALAR